MAVPDHDTSPQGHQTLRRMAGILQKLKVTLDLKSWDRIPERYCGS
jgi:hypothetical protein